MEELEDQLLNLALGVLINIYGEIAAVESPNTQAPAGRSQPRATRGWAGASPLNITAS